MIRRGILYLSESSNAKKVLTGTPMTRSVSQRFVPGEGVDDVIRAAHEANEQGLKVTANYLGEAVTNKDQARAAADTYLKILDQIQDQSLDANVSLKFTQMGQDIDEDFLAENLGRVLERSRRGQTFVRFDMESSEYVQRTLDAFESLWEEGWRDIGVVLQAYLKRTAGDVRRMIELGARVRLCKGAYREPESVAYQDMDRIRENFLELMRWLVTEGNYPGLATHDDFLVEEIHQFVQREGIESHRFEFQMLYGVRRDLQQQLLDHGYNVRVYVPFGEKWYPYLMRRLAERPENVWFMLGSVVKESPLGFFWKGRGGSGQTLGQA
jgi:proline dehydrogenase